MPRSARHLRHTLGILCVATAAGCGGAAPRPDVLLITIDTLRADFVHSYGFALDTTPNIDALAAAGVLFETAIAASTSTVPAHASIMTSRYVREHSVGSSNGDTRLEGALTLAERFRSAGYETAAFVSNVVLKKRTGLDRGFDHYDDELPAAEANRGIYFERSAEGTAGRAREWLERPRDAPFFVWVHLQDPHGPYAPPPPWGERVGELPLRTELELPLLRVNRGRGGIPAYQALDGVRRAPRYAGLYAGEIAFADHWVGELLKAARTAAGRGGLVVALTADHGESQGEDGFFFQHGHTTTPEQARVPLVVAAPGITPRRVSGVASHVDLAPTLLELAALPPLADASGISLVPVLRGGALPERSVVSDVGHELSAYDERGYLRVAVRAEGELDWQRYERSGEGHAGHEKGTQVELPPELVRYIRSALPPVPAHAMSDSDLERLRALGYLPPEDGPE